ncbi:MAG TPA: metal-dependent hydrolase [Burkholderiales bacterium]|nr:metal-dependent hydrolase [Burkholderiales bacterium]
MDLITHSLAGATLAGSVAPGPLVRRAAAVGAVASLLPDVDVLIRAAGDPLLTVEYHRHFTHSLVFAPFGALLIAALAWLFLRGGMTFARIFLYAALGVLSAGLLDTCTSFGTHLLWPFSDQRIAWNVIAVLDPLFSLILLVALGFALAWRSAVPARIGVAVALLYLLVGFAQHQRAGTAALQLAQARGHAVERMEVKPTLGNLVLWRSVYLSGEVFHVDAVRVASGRPLVYPGGALPRFHPDQLDAPPGPVQTNDIERFRRVSDDYLVVHPQRPRVIGDVRYAMLPNSTLPLWGIALDPDAPERHVDFIPMRSMTPAMRRDFVDMLRGRPLQPAD